MLCNVKQWNTMQSKVDNCDKTNLTAKLNTELFVKNSL